MNLASPARDGAGDAPSLLPSAAAPRFLRAAASDLVDASWRN